MVSRCLRATLTAACLVAGLPSTAAADWYLTPFVGWDFNATTTLIDPDYAGAARTKFTLGGSATWLRGIVGLEGDYAYVPGFFTLDAPATFSPNPQTNGTPTGGLVVSSRVQTLTGSFLVTTPLSLTRESLRPYAAIGIGVMDASTTPLGGTLPIDARLLAISFGGGAFGMLSNTTGVRFDLRYFNNIDRDLIENVSLGPAQLSFWRGTIGFVIKP